MTEDEKARQYDRLVIFAEFLAKGVEHEDEYMGDYYRATAAVFLLDIGRRSLDEDKS